MIAFCPLRGHFLREDEILFHFNLVFVLFLITTLLGDMLRTVIFIVCFRH